MKYIPVIFVGAFLDAKFRFYLKKKKSFIGNLYTSLDVSRRVYLNRNQSEFD